MADPRGGLINTLTFGLFGDREEPPSRPLDMRAPVPRYPDQSDVDLARKSDVGYGDPKALGPGERLRQIPPKLAPYVVNDARFDQVPWQKVDDKMADQLVAASLAAKKSAIASLGFEPRKFVMTPASDTSMEGKPNAFNAAGVFFPSKDAGWVDADYPDSLVHESIHRGLNIMREKGLLADNRDAETRDVPYLPRDAEENVVRAIMLQKLGGVEKGAGSLGDEQVAQAEASLKDPRFVQFLDRIETLAQKAVAAERPGGPR